MNVFFGFYAIAPYFGCMATILAIASTPLFKWADTPPSSTKTRISTIDGLRGFLALAVFFHHGTIYRNWLLHHVWEVPPSRFYTQLGQTGVAFFFMITGYLFWGRLVRHKGRVNFQDLYIGRIFRIGPLYLFAVAVMLAIVFWHTGLKLRVPLPRLVHELTVWLALGFFGGGPEVNGYSNSGTLLAGVTWSLQVEWWFYLSLLATCFIARSQGRFIYVIILPLIPLLPLVDLHHLSRFVPYGYLIMGMFCASLERDGLLLKTPDWVSSSAITLLLVTDFMIFSSAYEALPMLLLGLCFYLIVSGSKLFGLLVWRAAIRLGDISYGTYLLQGLVLYSIFSFSGLRKFAFWSPITYWIVLLCCSVLLVAIATLAHITIERPGVVLGKLVIRTIPRKTRNIRAASDA